jgi:thioredoxin-related protein
MKRNLFYFVFGLVLISSLSAQTNEQISWLTPQELKIAQQNEPRLVYVDVYTSWCGWCKKMEAEAFQDSFIVHYLNEHYYAVKFDAETSATISFNDSNYQTQTGAKYNDLAIYFLEGKLFFPSSAILGKNSKRITSVKGYLTPEKLEKILVFFEEEFFQGGDWTVFDKSYVRQK